MIKWDSHVKVVKARIKAKIKTKKGNLTKEKKKNTKGMKRKKNPGDKFKTIKKCFRYVTVSFEGPI